ncbi:MAG TPA: hypothetical protein VGP47_05595, partial [Parachlamydiaceae bacterium]|nr:hypothetical protein [Parachlamydiaceae bacterium]
MQPLPNSSMPAYGSKQVTISSDESPTRVILTLKKRETALISEEKNLKSLLENSVNALGQSALSKSLMDSGKQVPDLDASGFYSMSQSEEELDSEEKIFEYIDIKEQLEVVHEEQSLVHDNIDIIQAHEEEVQEITTLQLVGRHLSNIIAEEGTTFLSTLVTGGVALYMG